MNIVQPPFWIRFFFKGSLWRKRTSEKVVYLTFDDGPVPEPTKWVLDELIAHDVKATFFCIGENAKRNSDLLNRILDEGHSIGNHTYNHLNGWNTNLDEYIRNVELCSEVFSSRLFRPPYGRLTMKQFRKLRKKFQIVFWDVLSVDYDKNLSAADCINNVMNHVRPGSIIVFHDSLKAADRMKIALPEVIDRLKRMKYRFERL
jgi:peptidoglycan/xylan/chitin deacetylase (PgdA/CDA1 family)